MLSLAESAAQQERRSANLGRVVPLSATKHLAGMSSLTACGGVYLGLRYGLGIIVSLANMFVLTRWIGPHAYGLFVTALGLTAFLAALSRGGIDTYIVRLASTPEKRVYDVATTLILGHS